MVPAGLKTTFSLVACRDLQIFSYLLWDPGHLAGTVFVPSFRNSLWLLSPLHLRMGWLTSFSSERYGWDAAALAVVLHIHRYLGPVVLGSWQHQRELERINRYCACHMSRVSQMKYCIVCGVFVVPSSNRNWCLSFNFGSLMVAQVNQYLDDLALSNVKKDRPGMRKALQLLLRNTSALEQKWLIRIILKVLKFFNAWWTEIRVRCSHLLCVDIVNRNWRLDSVRTRYSMCFILMLLICLVSAAT